MTHLAYLLHIHKLFCNRQSESCLSGPCCLALAKVVEPRTARYGQDLFISWHRNEPNLTQAKLTQANRVEPNLCWVFAFDMHTDMEMHLRSAWGQTRRGLQCHGRRLIKLSKYECECESTHSLTRTHMHINMHVSSVCVNCCRLSLLCTKESRPLLRTPSFSFSLFAALSLSFYLPLFCKTWLVW